MKIKTKLSVSLGAISLLMGIVGWFAINSLANLEKQNTILQAVNDVDSLFFQARLNQADYLITKNAKYSQNLSSLVDKADSQLAKVKSSMQVQKSIDQVSDIQRAIQEYYSTFTTLKGVIDGGGTTDTSALTQQMMTSADNASRLSDQLVQAERSIATDVRDSISNTILVAVIFSFAISAGLAVYLVKAITRPLNQSMEIADAIAQGDLTVNVDVSGDDEFACLNRALLKSTHSLNGIVSELKQVATQLADIGNTVGISVSETSASIDSQQSETDQLAAAIEQLAASATQIAQSAASASESSKTSNEEAQKGETIAKASRESMSELTVMLDEATQSVDKLNNDTKSIATIVEVIQGIAEQTNLLALNAAIEAARAGEQGRGFAVVADEVRNLAQRTKSSTVEISNIVETIGNASGQVVDVINKANSQSSKATEMVSEASQTYANIITNVQNMTDINYEVASAAEQQSNVSSEVSSNVMRIKGLCDQNTHNLASISEQSQQQIQVSTKLTELIGFFRSKETTDLPQQSVFSTSSHSPVKDHTKLSTSPVTA
jgi:methyl-accepting chemotaxis protein